MEGISMRNANLMILIALAGGFFVGETMSVEASITPIGNSGFGSGSGAGTLTGGGVAPKATQPAFKKWDLPAKQKAPKLHPQKFEQLAEQLKLSDEQYNKIS